MQKLASSSKTASIKTSRASDQLTFAAVKATTFNIASTIIIIIMIIIREMQMKNEKEAALAAKAKPGWRRKHGKLAEARNLPRHHVVVGRTRQFLAVRKSRLMRLVAQVNFPQASMILVVCKCG